MNWKRGCVFAGIHLTLAASLMIWDEAPFWKYLRTDRNAPVSLPHDQNADPLDPDLSLNRCDEGSVWDGPMPVPEQVIAFANFPAILIAGGHTPCATPSPLNRRLQKRYGRTHRSEALTLTILCAAVAIQWLLVGGFPLISPSHWRLDPGVLITTFTLPMLGLAFIPAIYPLTFRLTLIFWASWLGLLIWNLGRSAWRLMGLGAGHAAL